MGDSGLGSWFRETPESMAALDRETEALQRESRLLDVFRRRGRKGFRVLRSAEMAVKRYRRAPEEGS